MITGANGHLGRRLAGRLKKEHIDVCAVVRSEHAKNRLLNTLPDLDVRVVDYSDKLLLAEVAGGCDAIVHLVGIIKEGEHSSYEDAHENATQTLVAASDIAGVEKIIYLSILGSSPDSRNACLASKGRAEELLLESHKGVVIRVPMVLGEGDYASLALGKSAGSGVAITFRADSLEQPIYAGDVIAAIFQALTHMTDEGVFDLAGPESLSRRSLIERAARIYGNSPKVVSLPITLGMMLAGIMEKLLKSPAVTRAMLGVLDHDDNIEPRQACEALGIKLSSLNETLYRVLPR